MLCEQRPRMLDVDDVRVEQRNLDQLKSIFGRLGDGQAEDLLFRLRKEQVKAELRRLEVEG